MIKIIMSHTLKNKERMQSIFIEAILEEMNIVKKTIKIILINILSYL